MLVDSEAERLCDNEEPLVDADELLDEDALAVLEELWEVDELLDKDLDNDVLLASKRLVGEVSLFVDDDVELASVLIDLDWMLSGHERAAAASFTAALGSAATTTSTSSPLPRMTSCGDIESANE